LGTDGEGRQVLTWVAGDVRAQPPWQEDDELNARRLGDLGHWLRGLHAATAGFEPRAGAEPARPLPVTGEVWTHGDPGYGNVVYRADRVVALIDWEFAAPADPLHDPAALLALSIRGPRPDRDDVRRRARAARLAANAIAHGFGMSDAEFARLPEIAAAVLDDAAEFLGATDSAFADRSRWRAAWFRDHAAGLVRG
jgi:hypothetical protein